MTALARGALTVALGAALAAMPLGAAGAQAARPEPPKPFAALSRTLLAGRDSLVELTRQQVGLRYRLGAKQPGRAFDCSALVQWIAALFGRELPRTAALQAQAGIPVPKDTSALLPGDLLVFGRGQRITHIGIYVGDGKFVHAANPRAGVIETDLAHTKPSWWKGVRRIFLDADSLLQTQPTVRGS